MEERMPSQQPAEQPGIPAEEPQALASKMAAMPHLPGVYLFKDGDGAILYVGKANDLRKRISSYLRHSASGDVKTRVFLGKATDIEYLVTSGEKEALLLEASFIKKHRPRYNVILRDDKNYPALRIDPREPFPRIEVVRRFQKDKAFYFGPYPSAHAVRETLKLLETLFPLRHCRGKRLIPRERPCLNHALGRCLGACAGKVTQEQYQKAAHEVILFLQGKTDALQRQFGNACRRPPMPWILSRPPGIGTACKESPRFSRSKGSSPTAFTTRTYSGFIRTTAEPCSSSSSSAREC